MARSLGVWVGVSILVCALIGGVYLPPRGVPKWAEGRIFLMREPNPQRTRARDLANKWLAANAAVLGEQYHDRVGPALAARRGRNQPGPILDLQAEDSIRDWAQPVVQGALDSAWKMLDLGVSKISVGVLLREVLPRGGSATPNPEYNHYGASWLLPDSTDRSTCLVVAELPYFVRNHRYLQPGRLVESGARLLGPCAWYARFGVPSPRVEQWLAARQFDVAITPIWYRRSSNEGVVNWVFGEEESPFLWWGGLYAYAPEALACLAGRPEECRRGLAAYDKGGIGSRPRVVVPFDPWESKKIKLIGGQVFLSDLLRVVGDDRFQEFWTTSLPVDSALTVALRKPVGEYTVSWLRSFSPAPKFGAGTSWLNAGLGFAFAAMMVGLVLLGQSRREVR
jgi:hypothetical protein